jgi:hypothetical protein
MGEEKEENVVIVWANQQLEQWHHIERGYLADNRAVEALKDICQQRLRVQQEMLPILNSFLEGRTTLKEFNQLFQQKTHVAWSVFHLGGMSGGLFLNKLVKYVPEEDTFAHLLRMMMRVPADQQDGQGHMRMFIRFLEGIIASQQATRLQLQPARVPFFLSACWHMQEVEQWPIFYLELRHILLPEEHFASPLRDPVEAYFVFHARFLVLKQELSLNTWELEQLIKWHYIRSISNKGSRSSAPVYCGCPRASPLVADVRNDEHLDATSMCNSAGSRRGNMIRKKGQSDTSRMYIQWLLAKIGLKVGCSVWVAIDDHEKVYNEERLGNLSLSSLPDWADAAFQQVAKHIDILWLRKNEIIAAYEIGQTTTDVSKILLQFSDLVVLSPKRDMQFCVVAPQGCYEHVQFELSRPIFQHHDMHKRSKIIFQEGLIQHAEHILRWANSPSVIQDLTCYLTA